MRKRLVTAILIMGLSGIIAEILLLRELLITFYGNELSIGIILANWLILEAIGAFFLGKRVESLGKRLEGFIGLTLVFSIFLPISIYLTRGIKDIIGVIPGQALGLIPIFGLSFLILLVVSISHGALFTFGCKIYSLYSPFKEKQEHAASVGKVYIYETLGTIVGGITLTYFLVPYFNSLEIALGVSFLNLVACVYLLKPFSPYSVKVPEKEYIPSLPAKILSAISLALLLLIIVLIFGGGKDKIHWYSIKNQWKGQEVVHYENSIYGNIVVTEREGQYTFFSNGIPIITAPVPDITFVEEFVHLPMLSHPKPEEILVISGGAGGVINEVLKHPSVERVDYVELDPLILKVVKKFVTPLTEAELDDARVNVEYADGRFFVKATSNEYDLIFIGLSNPSDLQVNRFFTREFFTLVKKRLGKEGILAVTLPGSLTYLSEELRNLNTCIINTINESYPYVRIIPGDFNLFLASKSPAVTLVDYTKFNERFRKRALDVNLLTPAHIKYRLSPRKLDWFKESLRGGPEAINQDFLPRGVFYSLSHWNALFSPYMQRLFKIFEIVNLRFIFILLLLFTLIILLFGFRIKNPIRVSTPLCITATGFAGIIFDLVLIFAFQALYGYVFHWIGLLVTALMVGIAVGSVRMTALLERLKRPFVSFIKIEMLIVLFSLALPMMFAVLHPYLDRPATFLLEIIFLILSFISGLLIGAQFPLANKIYLAADAKPQGSNLGRTAGLLYGADLLGGWIGGIIGGVILLPVLGLIRTCMMIAMLKVSSLIIFATFSSLQLRKN
jgi:spermidine synthase